MKKHEIHLESGSYYHIYNRAVGDENLFYSEANYFYFLKKYQEYISPVVETFSYCLMPNHFHFLIRIKSEEEIVKIIKIQSKPDRIDPPINLYISKQFSNLFNGYSQAINKQQIRNGTLFSRPFKRKKVESMEYMRNLVIYIHSNPINHGFTSNLSEWKYSSYNSIISGSNFELKGKEVINWFENLNNFSETHKKYKVTSLLKMELD